ncbi:alpha/beta fold hydrolase [Nakamurella sp. GG22]
MTPPLVLLHAFPLDSRMFDPIRAGVAEHADLLTPDLRGFGSGPALGDPPPDPDLALLAEDVVAALDDQGIERAIVGGVSMGGYVALAMLRAHPDRVAGLVLVDTRSGADDGAALERRRAAAERADEGEISSGLDAVGPLIAKGAAAPVRETLASIAAGVPAPTVGWAQRAMAARPDSTDVLAAADVPVLVVVGEHDTVTPPDEARAMAAAVPGAELVQLPDAGHLSPAEDPDGFTLALTGWLGRQF